MRSTLRRVVAPAVVAATLAGAGVGFNANASATFQLSRVAGTDRYATASAVAANAFAAGAPSAVIARGDAFPDALAGRYLAGIAAGPLPLTQSDALPPATKDRLTALGVKSVFLLGGTGAVSQGVQDELAKSYTVTRVGGNNRYDTASRIAQITNPVGIGTIGGSKTAIVASGETFPDALGGGPAAGKGTRPLVLTAATSLSPDTASWLQFHAAALQGGRAFGGTSAIADSTLAAAVQAAGGAVQTVNGQVVRVDATNHRYTFVPNSATTAITDNHKATATSSVDSQLTTTTPNGSDISHE